jgi:hypothetical protein
VNGHRFLAKYARERLEGSAMASEAGVDNFAVGGLGGMRFLPRSRNPADRVKKTTDDMQ